MVQLRAISGPLAGQTVEISGEVVVGRRGTDLVVDDPEVSRRHAVIRLRGNDLEVEDLGSSNGTFVDGKRIEAPLSVHNGAHIRIGASVLLTEGLPSPAEQPLADPNATRVRGLPGNQPTRLAPVSPPASEPTRVGERVAAVASEPAVSAPGPPARAAPAAPAQAPSVPVSEFRPPERRRSRGLASRSWVPVVLSYGTAGATAAALIVYFATR